MKLGAEPKKVAILAVLLPVAGYLVYKNFLAAPGYGPAGAPAAAPAPPAAKQAASASLTPTRSAAPRRSTAAAQEWVPTLRPRRGEDRPDPATVDPTLRLELLARLGEVSFTGGGRSLFEFSQPPAPKVAEPKIVPQPVAPPAEPVKPVDPPKPPPAPIPLKFYGFVNGPGGRRAFFLNGEDILVAAEGETVQSRYRVLQIGLSSAVVEDTQQKNQQTLPLEQPREG